MTMVMDNHNRQFGGMGYDNNIYSNQLHSTPQFSDPWQHHSNATTTSSLYHSSVPAPSLPAKQEHRPTSIALPYSNVPTSNPSMTTGSSYPTSLYGATDSLSLPQDIPRTTYGTEQSYTSTAPSSYAPSYSSLNYAQSLHSQQAQQHEQVRRMSNP